MRVWAVSDIHTDYAQNLEWVRALAAGGGGSVAGLSRDVLLVAGDVSDDLATLEKTLQPLVDAFAHVFFVPGNHDLWVRRDERGQYDSLEKLRRVQALCARLGVRTEPACVGGVWIFPILSWYHASWDREPDVPGAHPISKARPGCVMLDFHVCSWASAPHLSPHNDSLALHFDALNEPAFSRALQEQAAAAGGARPPVLSFSHFLPRQELLPEKRMLYQPNLAKAAGSDALEARVRRLRPLAHVFGHTHFSWDAEVEGVRYVQWPLGYPQEHARRRGGGAGWLPLPLFDSDAVRPGVGDGRSGLAPPQACYWSDLYSTYPRNPANITAAPWVTTTTRA
ncbi:hypothetical protein CHLNCDRAFT_21755 [Chlorella variabilis]|uniref:Calcineurin-like phosphoesterase domain-containing protein n=1 Tax=Chlorella variabilis TaxID=554065 RepID=E1ZA11_CHLVA|nr:hypothetical protein CHLNCDRAFT_21755 [Chlorella variabilis]EFN56980.1 hypothetical protein CHLNCDRAFT_21755 [Chlorella variabilis]|eukprot:XP_005849082.1 hypothetical protein CHLNCDRAFT_21755 [Chlorella variabilis]